MRCWNRKAFATTAARSLTAVWAAALWVAFSGCVSRTEERTSVAAPALSVGEVERRVPASVKDATGWATDISAAIEATGKAPTVERVCAVIAVIGQESGFQVDPRVQGLPQIVRKGMLAKLKPLGPLADRALETLLAVEVPGEKVTFAKKVESLRSERDLDRLFRSMSNVYRNRMPGTFLVAQALSKLLGNGAFEDLNPITTAGSMQVKIARARAIPAFDRFDDAGLREHLYTRSGGIEAGTHALINEPASYDDMIFRFADYNAGPYASRNAAFQKMLIELTGRPLVLDGDLLAYDARGEPVDEESNSLAAVFAFTRPRGSWDFTVKKAVRAEKTVAFEETELWTDVRSAYEAKTGKTAPYAVLPQLTLISPKLQGARSTEWFASSVKRRYDACRALKP